VVLGMVVSNGVGLATAAATSSTAVRVAVAAGEPTDRTVRMTDASERAIKIVTDVLEGRMDETRKSFNAEVPAAFTDEVRGNGMATVTGIVGAFEGFGETEPFVRRIGDHTVVDIPLRYEAGDMKARVTFDTDEKVAAIVILPPETR
jgi:hypothetical protein